MSHADDPVTHYDKINRAWQLVLGEDFHFGFFKAAGETLEEATANLTALMADRAEIGPGMSVLDVGCGVGNPGCWLADKFGCHVTGITTSAQGVALAAARARSRGLSSRAAFAVADGMDNGLPDASFDRVWVMESSHLMPRKDALLSECSRVMRPGARLVLCDIILHRELPLAEVLSRARDFAPLHFAFGHAKMETFATYDRLAGRAGLEIVEMLDISSNMFPTFASWRQRLGENEAAVRAEIGGDGFEHLEAACDILAKLWNEHLLGYGLIVAEKS